MNYSSVCGSGMVYLLEQLFWVICMAGSEETVPKQWGEGLIVILFKKDDREDPGNYRGITLLSVVGKVFCNNRLVQCGGVLHEGQAGFRVNRNSEVACGSRSTVLLEGEKSAMFSVEQGVAQGCSLSRNAKHCGRAGANPLGVCACACAVAYASQ